MDIVFNSIKFLDGKKYILYASVIMPNHFHLIIHPIEKEQGIYFSTSEIMHSIKSYSALKINEIRRSTILVDKTINQRNIWQHENCDRIIRNEAEFKKKIEYIMSNPIKLGLMDSNEKYKWIYIAN